MWGIIPAAGSGTRIQPLAFSKELLPVGGRIDGAVERPRAISEYLVDRMITGGANKLCFVIAPGKSDILEYYGGVNLDSVTISFVVQPHPSGLCDAILAAPLIAANEMCVSVCPTLFGFRRMRWALCLMTNCHFFCFLSRRRNSLMQCARQQMAACWRSK